MPQDPNLYGQPPPKKRKGNMALSSSLDFTAQLTSLMSSSTGTTSSTPSARPRKSANTTKTITPLSRKARADRDAKDTKLVLKDAPGEDEAEVLARTRRKMEAKARLYAAMKRGDYIPKENEAAPLVDFDRKWAETKDDPAAADTSSGEDDDDDDHPTSEDKPTDTELIEYEDDLGRTRLVTRAERDRLERQRRRGLLGAEELERMSARPAAPSNLIYGDTIQTLAFVPEDEEKMEAIARKRDRSATPPDQKHYDADSEIRNRGTGFFKFSKDEETRLAQMTSLEEERARTEARRREQDDAKAARRKEIEDRRRDLEARRAKKMADSFLDGLAADLGTKEPPPT